MTQYRTNNPLGSMAPRDLYDNAQNIDNWSNGVEPFYEDRFGLMRRSFSGMNFEFEAAQTGREAAFVSSQTDKESRFQAFLLSSGYVSKGDYAVNVVLEERNEYVAVDAATTGTTAGLYRPNAEAVLPLTLTGTWATDSTSLVLLGDDVLRQELANYTNPAQGAALIGRAVVAVSSIGDLQAIPSRGRREDVRVLVRGYHEDSATGGGEFQWSNGDYSQQVLSDPQRGVWVAPAGEDGSSGAWIRVLKGFVTTEHFGSRPGELGDDALEGFLAFIKVSKIPGYITSFQVTKTYTLDQSFSGCWISRADNSSELVFPTGFDFDEQPDVTAMFVLRPSAGQTLQNLYFKPPILNGNKAGTTSSSANRVHGIIVRKEATGVLDNVTIENPVCHDFHGQGILVLAGGAKLVRPYCHNNTWHGIGVSSEGEFGEKPNVMEDPLCCDNGGYGIDFSRGRTNSRGVAEAYRNMQGGAKCSVDCLEVFAEVLRLHDNQDYGFRTTGQAPELILRVDVFDIARTVNAANAGSALNISTGKSVTIGTAILVDNNSDASADFNISAPVFKADSIYIENSKKAGALFYQSKVDIGLLHIKGSAGAAYNLTSCSGVIDMAVLDGNNTNGATGSNAAAARYTGADPVSQSFTRQIVLFDSKTVPTQTTGIYVANGHKAVIGSISPSSIAEGQVVLTASSGTEVIFESNTAGAAVIAKGRLLLNGGQSSYAVTYPNALLNVAGANYDITLMPRTAASQPAFVSSRDQQGFTLAFPANTPAGTGNIDVEYVARLSVNRTS